MRDFQGCGLVLLPTIYSSRDSDRYRRYILLFNHVFLKVSRRLKCLIVIPFVLMPSCLMADRIVPSWLSLALVNQTRGHWSSQVNNIVKGPIR
jgi:hypothetical protein